MVKNRIDSWLAPAVAAGALVVYLATLAPALTVEHAGTDGGDLIAAASTLGVPHPTGYPTYTLLAWLFVRWLPFGTIAYRANLLSAACAAAAAGLTCATAARLMAATPHGRLVAAAAGLALAFTSILWSQATIAEVYALLALFAALLLWLLVRWRQGGSDRLLWAAALSFGLGLGNHLTLAWAAPAALILLWPERRRWLHFRVLGPAALLFAAGLSVYVYLPLAALRHPPVNWGDPHTAAGFMWVVTARQYQSFALGLDPAEWPNRAAIWAWHLGDQFGWWGLPLVVVGGWRAWHNARSAAGAGLVWALLAGGYAFFYFPSDSYLYLVAVLPLLALAWGLGVEELLALARRLGPAGARLALVLVAILPLGSLALHWRAADLHTDWTAYAYMHQALEGAAPGALIVVREDAPTFVLWYGLHAERRRPDVAVVSGPLLAYTWYRDQVRRLYPELGLGEPDASDVTTDTLVRKLVAANLTRRPVYATDPPQAWEAWFEFGKDEGSPLYRVIARN